MADRGSSDAGFYSRQFEDEKSLAEPNVYVSLTYDELDAKAVMDRVKSPKAGAVVLFAGTLMYPYNTPYRLMLTVYSKLNHK